MDGFRAILALLSVAVIGFVYWFSQREKNRTDDDDRIEPFLHADDAETEDPPDDLNDAPLPTMHATPLDATADGADVPQQEELEIDELEPAPEKIVAIRVVGKGDDTFNGEELVLALRGLGLRHGQFGIFHRHDGDEDPPVFSVANLIEPGTFELANIREQRFPGISLFAVLPGRLPGPEAFDMMIETARTLAKNFEGEVLDASGSTLSIQRERFMREEIIQFEHTQVLPGD